MPERDQNTFNASKIIAVLIERLGEPQVITEEEMAGFVTNHPTLFTLNEKSLTVEIDERHISRVADATGMTI